VQPYKLHPIDLSIAGLYVVFVIGLGIYLARSHKGAEDYFLGGRTFIWPLVGLSLYASNMSSSSLVGMAGSAYGTGISVFNYEWMAAVILVFFAIFFYPICSGRRYSHYRSFLSGDTIPGHDSTSQVSIF